MSSPLVLKYPLDYTGQSPTNRVVGEVHNLSTNPNRAFVPDYGPFYTDSMVVMDTSNGRILTRETDYLCLQTFGDATAASGLEVCGVVLITNPAVSNAVSFTGQQVGGPFSDYSYALQQMINDLQIDNRSVVWGQIIGTPSAYPPAPHMHAISDTYGWEYMASAIDDLRQAILMGDQPAMDALRQSLFSQFLLYQPKIGYVPVEQGISLVEGDAGKIVLSSNGDGQILGSLNGQALGQILFSSSQINDVIADLQARVSSLETVESNNTAPRLAALENLAEVTLPGQINTVAGGVLTNAQAIADLASRISLLETAVTFGALNISPADGTVGSVTTPTLVGDSYFPKYGVTQKFRNFQVIQHDGDFSAPLINTNIAPSGGNPALQFAITSALGLTESYGWRYRDQTIKGQFGVWSAPTYFSTSSAYVVTPTVTAPTANATNVSARPTITISAFAWAGTADTFKSQSIRITNKVTGVVAWLLDSSTVQSTSVVVPANTLAAGTAYTVEARYVGTLLGPSAWSTPQTFNTQATFINTPTITSPANGAVINTTQPTIVISPFATSTGAGSDTLQSTSARIMNGQGAVIWQQTNSTTQLNNIVVPANILIGGGNNYTIQVQYTGANFGNSAWSDPTAVTTATIVSTTVVTSQQTQTSIATVASTSTSYSTSRATQVGLSTTIQTSTSQATSVNTNTSFNTSLAFNTSVARTGSTTTSWVTSFATITTYASTNPAAQHSTTRSTFYVNNTATTHVTGVVKSKATTTFKQTSVYVCVAEGTLILLPDGTEVPVETLKAGDQLTSVMLPGLQPETVEEYQDYHASSLEGAAVSVTNIKTMSPATVPVLYDIWSDGSADPLRVTPDHPFLVQDTDGTIQFVTAEQLTLDDKLVNSDLSLVSIDKIETETGSFNIFKIDCAPLDLFIHDNIVGHNLKIQSNSPTNYYSYFNTSFSTTTTWTSSYNTTTYKATNVPVNTSYITVYASTNNAATRSTTTTRSTSQLTTTNWVSSRSTLTTWVTSRSTVSSFVTAFTKNTVVGSTAEVNTSFLTSNLTNTSYNSLFNTTTSFNTQRNTNL